MTIDVRGYSDEINACVAWPEWLDLHKERVHLPLTAHDPHFPLGTININGTESETTDFVWHTLMNTVRWWCKSKEWVHIDFEPDDDFSLVIPKESCEFVNLFRRLQFVFVAVPMLLGSSARRRWPTSQTHTWSSRTTVRTPATYRRLQVMP